MLYTGSIFAPPYTVLYPKTRIGSQGYTVYVLCGSMV
jgi:hypothetical protein